MVLVEANSLEIYKNFFEMKIFLLVGSVKPWNIVAIQSSLWWIDVFTEDICIEMLYFYSILVILDSINLKMIIKQYWLFTCEATLELALSIREDFKKKKE